MSADVRTVLDRAAGGATAAPDTAAILRRGRRLRRRRRTLTATAALLAPLAVIALVRVPAQLELAGPSAVGSVLALPAVGDVVAVHLDDGTPVFVVHEDDGDVHVVEALDPHGPAVGIGILVGWCPSVGMFEELLFASRWWPDGGYAGGPTPSALPTYATEPAGEGSLRVTARREAAPREGSSATSYEPVGPGCVNMESSEAVANLDAHHAAEPAVSPEDAVASPDGSRVLVEGVLEVLDGAPIRLCTPRPQPGPSCDEHSPEVAADDLLPPDEAGAVIRFRGRLLATVADGGFRDVTATGATVWDMEIFREEDVLTGTLALFPPPPGTTWGGWSGSSRGPDELPELLLHVAGEYYSLHLAPDATVLGGDGLTGSPGPTPATPEDLLDLARDRERAAATRFEVTVRRADGQVTRIEELP